MKSRLKRQPFNRYFWEDNVLKWLGQTTKYIGAKIFEKTRNLIELQVRQASSLPIWIAFLLTERATILRECLEEYL